MFEKHVCLNGRFDRFVLFLVLVWVCASKVQKPTRILVSNLASGDCRIPHDFVSSVLKGPQKLNYTPTAHFDA